MRKKSKILVFKRGCEERNEVRGIKEIEGIEVVRSMKYLGVEISDGKDIFQKQKEKDVGKGEEDGQDDIRGNREELQ